MPGEHAVISAGFRVPPTAIHVVPHPMKSDGPPVFYVGLSQFGLTAGDFGSLAGDTGSTPSTNPSTPGVFGCANQKMEVHLFGGTASLESTSVAPHAHSSSMAVPLARRAVQGQRLPGTPARMTVRQATDPASGVPGSAMVH